MFSYNGIYVSLAVVVCIYITAVGILRRKKIKLKYLFYISPVAILLGLAFSRIFYVFFNSDLYTNFSDKLKLTDGGYMLYGGIFGAVCGIVLWCVFAKRKKLIVPLLDTASFGAVLGICVGRLGAAFYEECYGIMVTNKAFCKLPFAVYIPSYDSYCMAVFLYESVACLLIALALLCVRRMYGDTKGAEFVNFIVMYAGARTFLESLRADSVYYGFVRVSQVISAVILLAVFTVYSVKLVRVTSFKKTYLVLYIGFALFLTSGFLSEFYMGSSSYVRNYVVLLICCILLTADTMFTYFLYQKGLKAKKTKKKRRNCTK